MVLSTLEALKASLLGSTLQVHVWLTFNLPEPELESRVMAKSWPFELREINNRSPLGFGANHNQAFARCVAESGPPDWFVVMNPDIFWLAGATEFWQGLSHWPKDVGLVCPDQVDVAGLPQDFARRLMTPWGLSLRVLRRALGSSPSGVAPTVDQADWVNGACMVWRGSAFAQLRGFDERYFMYCEDTDICLRLQLAGGRMCAAGLSVVHDAQRQTGRSARHLRWHLASLLRLWCSGAFWRYAWRSCRMKA
jgi:GT2 family glycosyltransferase